MIVAQMTDVKETNLVQCGYGDKAQQQIFEALNVFEIKTGKQQISSVLELVYSRYAFDTRDIVVYHIFVT